MAYTTRMSLLSRVRKGDEVSWEEFYDIYHGYFLGMCLKRGIKEHDANDIIQNTLIEIYKKKKIDSFNKSIAKFRTHLFWVFKSNLRNFWRDYYRNNKHLIPSDHDYEEIDTIIDEKINQIDKDLRVEWAKHLTKLALFELREKITTRNYQIFESLVIEGNSVKNVADFFDITENNVNQIRSRTKKMLDSFIKENFSE